MGEMSNESSEAVPHNLTVAWHSRRALHGCGVNVTTVLLLVSQHIDRVAWGSSASTKSGSRAPSLVVHHHVGARLEKRI